MPEVRGDLRTQHPNPPNGLSSDVPQGHRSGGVRSSGFLGAFFDRPDATLGSEWYTWRYTSFLKLA